MKSYELNFSFKGARQYIQGPDIFNECVCLLQEQFNGTLEGVEFVIHRMTDSNLLLTVCNQEESHQPVAQAVAELRFKAGGKSLEALLVEKGGRPESRHTYDESLVVDRCDIDLQDRQIVFDGGEVPYSAMETLVSMNKALHLKVFPNLVGSWVFCRWSCPRWPLSDNLNGVRIQLIQALGTRLTRSEVSLEGNVLGHIYFSARSNK